MVDGVAFATLQGQCVYDHGLLKGQPQVRTPVKPKTTWLKNIKNILKWWEKCIEIIKP